VSKRRLRILGCVTGRISYCINLAAQATLTHKRQGARENVTPSTVNKLLTAKRRTLSRHTCSLGLDSSSLGRLDI
jgi:hypothetical protein